MKTWAMFEKDGEFGEFKGTREQAYKRMMELSYIVSYCELSVGTRGEDVFGYHTYKSDCI